MKAPKELRTYCPRCDEHTVQSITLYKKGRERAMSWGARRHQDRKRGYGGQKYPKQRRTAKVTKKQTLKLKCTKCGYTRMKRGVRLKKLEIER